MEKIIDQLPSPNKVNLHEGSEALNFAGASGAALPPFVNFLPIFWCWERPLFVTLYPCGNSGLRNKVALVWPPQRDSQSSPAGG